MTEQNLTIAFIGCGNLSSSLVKGLVAAAYPKDKIWVTNRSADKNKILHETLGVNTSEDNVSVLEKADVIVLGVKPQQMYDLTKNIASVVRKKKPLVISVAVGITTEMLHRWLGKNLSIVRSMPNTPALVSAGASGLFANKQVTQKQKDFAESLHRSVGIALWVEEESHIDIVAALSGSGPAYFFYIIEAMEAAGVKFGLAASVSKELALQTALGASKLALESSDDVKTLRKQVTSPNGTTEQAIRIFDLTKLPNIIEEGMKAAIFRAAEISESLNQ